MAESAKFSDPKFIISKVYTKKGDGGTTCLVGGQEVPKNQARIEAFGTVDELNAFLGAACISIKQDLPECQDRVWLLGVLNRIQHELFNMGSILATHPNDVHPKQPQILESDIDILEQEIDYANEQLPALKSFVLPGGCRASADLHICRRVPVFAKL